jgi:ribonuclease PH
MTTLDINKATQPYEYYLKFIKQNCRPDCRKLSDIRPCNISFNCIETVNGSAMVKLGATNVVCGISTRVCKPRVEMPNKGDYSSFIQTILRRSLITQNFELKVLLYVTLSSRLYVRKKTSKICRLLVRFLSPL